MEDFERKLRRTAAKRRQDDSPPSKARAPIDSDRRQRRIAVRMQKLNELGIKVAVCPVCGCDDVSRLEFDHPAGRKHDDQVWPLCDDCHKEKTSMFYEQPPVSGDPRNVFQVIGRGLLGMAEYFEMLIRHLRKWGEFLIEVARQGYGAELSFPT